MKAYPTLDLTIALNRVQSILLRVGRRIPLIREHPRLLPRLAQITRLHASQRQTMENARNIQGHLCFERDLKKYGCDVRGIPKSINDALDATMKGEISNYDYKVLVDRLRCMPNNALRFQDWQFLNQLFCFCGRHVLAGVCREHARQQAIKPILDAVSKPPISWQNSIAAYVEGGECTDLERLNGALRLATVSHLCADHWRSFFCALRGLPQLGSLNGDDAVLEYFLKGKSVVVVGPAESAMSDAKDIDKADLVIRFNHSFANCEGLDPIVKGERTDITYFNHVAADVTVTQHEGMLPPELKWVCTKSVDAAIKLGKPNPRVKCRRFVGYQDLVFHGDFNMVPAAALDLVALGVRNIKLYHADVSLTLGRQKSYITGFNITTEDIEFRRGLYRRSHTYHDPVLQYRTLHHLWSGGSIFGDEAFTRVMNIGLENYLYRLETTHLTQKN